MTRIASTFERIKNDFLSFGFQGLVGMIVRSERLRLAVTTLRQIVLLATGIAAIPDVAGLLWVGLLQYRIQEYACGCLPPRGCLPLCSVVQPAGPSGLSWNLASR